MLIIPTENPTSHFSFGIDLENYSWNFEIKYNLVDESWYLNLTGLSTNEIINGIKLVGGVDLLAPYGMTSLGQLYMADTTGQYSDPDYDLLGIRYQLYYVTRDEII